MSTTVLQLHHEQCNLVMSMGNHLCLGQMFGENHGHGLAALQEQNLNAEPLPGEQTLKHGSWCPKTGNQWCKLISPFYS